MIGYNEFRNHFLKNRQIREVRIMKKTVRYGILSTSSIIPRFVRGLNLTGSGTVIAIASRSSEKAAAMAQLRCGL